MESPENPRSPRVGLVYDERMCRHATPDGERHPENPQRIRAIWRKLQAERILERCVVLNANHADDKHLAYVHTKRHIDLIRTISSDEFDSRRPNIASKFNSIYFNKGSSEAAYLAAGSVVEASMKVASRELSSAMAVVRPPGHHAETNEAMGFCIFNNIAIAANVLLNERPELGIQKILIVDWDVHHGNGTQKAFYSDPRVLFFSIHRFDFGSFYPAGGDGSICMIGEDLGMGYNINVPWEHGKCGDADYIAVWDHILIPVAEAYNPDIILISAGFDAAIGDPLGGCCITPFGYSLMLKKLMRFAGGKIMMALEGGYNLNSISNSVLACIRTLLEEKPIDGSLESRPFESTWRVIQEVRNELKKFWPILSFELPLDILISNNHPLPVECVKYTLMVLISIVRCFPDVRLAARISAYMEELVDWQELLPINCLVDNDDRTSNSRHSINHVEIVDDVTVSLTTLNLDGNKLGKAVTSNDLPREQSSAEASHSIPTLLPQQINSPCPTWRSGLSKFEVWYASFGSNMSKDRFLCYIKGGKAEGMNKPCRGSRDKSLPRDVFWNIVPHKLFFALSHSSTWGKGGVAFLHPESNTNDRAYVCIYRITLEQFNDVLFQENRMSPDMEQSPLLDESQLKVLAESKTMLLEVLGDGWYSNVLHLGEEDGLPILTMTCPFSYVDRFKSGELPTCAPAESYKNTLLKGLVEGKQLTREEAEEYIKNAIDRKL
ncbi:histone deacetylase 5-like [Asparagus officinalis]|uniref:histone deacetylase 5-like n=1 Tax=Asparagus officinalis TaxID=4686 RepID=UPI00098E8717|nr:histone deacetylase 5-like [Asparagus officinalis]